MTLLFSMNLGLAWGETAAPPVVANTSTSLSFYLFKKTRRIWYGEK